MSKYIETRRLGASALRALCIERSWYTRGDNEEYDHLLTDLAGGKPHFLDELDEDNVALRFQSAMTVSLAFLLLARCCLDLDNYFEPEDFGGIGDFNTRDVMTSTRNTRAYMRPSFPKSSGWPPRRSVRRRRRSRPSIMGRSICICFPA